MADATAPFSLTLVAAMVALHLSVSLSEIFFQHLFLIFFVTKHRVTLAATGHSLLFLLFTL